MYKTLLKYTAALALLATPAAAADLDVAAAHASFTDAFNARDWDALRGQLADDIVFHRATGDTVYIGADAVIERFSSTIGHPDQWNVKFAILDSSGSFAGDDGRVVERGDFAVTAGGDDSACYRGSYLMTWTGAQDPKLQMLAWQDVETALENCKN